MDPRNNIATDLFYKIRSRFKGLKLGDETGVVTINPDQARFFDFDYMNENVPIGHVSISIAEPAAMKVYYSTGITEGMQVREKTNWYSFLKELRQFAKRRLMSFDTRDIAKNNLDKRDYEYLSQTQSPNKPVGESTMTESSMYGTKHTSYQKLQDTKLIIKHSKALTDDMAPGARARNISSLFVENSQGERFKYPFIHLAGARAMQRHVANNGLPYDEIGKSIIKMSEEIAQLKSFSNYVTRNDLMNSDTNDIVVRSTTQLESLREQISKLSKQHHYEEYKNNFRPLTNEEIPEDIAEQFVDKFTVKNFKEDIKSVFPVLYRLMKEQSTIGYNDIVAMTANNETTVAEAEDSYDPLASFESWIMNLGEESAITSQDEDEKAQAIKSLQELVGQHFSAGVDGENAIQSLTGIIEDPELYKQIKDQAKEDPEACCRGLIKDWLEQNAPEVVGQLDFGDYSEEPADGGEPADNAAPEEVPQEESDGPNKSDVPAYLRKQKGGDDWKMSTKDMDDEKTKSPTSSAGLARRKQELGMENQQSMNIRELAEFIHSFYDRNTGTFPKGPEGVCTMVGKKFGEQAEHVARKMVERMAPQQQDTEMNELARIRELAGF
jgi:hypothetical protein